MKKMIETRKIVGEREPPEGKKRKPKNIKKDKIKDEKLEYIRKAQSERTLF